MKEGKPTTPVRPGASSCDRATPCSSFLFPRRSRVAGRPRKRGRGRKGGGEVKGTLQVSLLPLGGAFNEFPAWKKFWIVTKKRTSRVQVFLVSRSSQTSAYIECRELGIVKIRKSFILRCAYFWRKMTQRLQTWIQRPDSARHWNCWERDNKHGAAYCRTNFIFTIVLHHNPEKYVLSVSPLLSFSASM